MPIYIGDYIADTGHLRAAEHGAYLLILFHYWRTGEGPPNDDARLASIARMSKTEWASVRDTIKAFFTVAETEKGKILTHERVETELRKAAEKYRNRQRASEIANAARHGNRNGLRNGEQNGSPNGSQPQPHFAKAKGAKAPRSPSGAPPSAPEPKNVHPTWNGKQAVLAGKIGDPNFLAYFAETELTIGPPAEIAVESEARREMIIRKFGPQLRTIFGNVEITVARQSHTQEKTQ